MKLRLLAGALALVLSFAPAMAQVNPGASPLSIQKGGTGAATLTNHGFVLGHGVGPLTAIACTSAQLAIGQSSADPICQTVTGDVTISAAGVTAIGASKVTNSQLATMAANTTKCNATAGTANPTDCDAATMRTNLGLVIGTNVEAWDADLDCIAGLSSTGVISRTGAGTCSAGALALSGLATGTQDTLIGYFGSTTASATAVPNCSGALTYSTATHTFGCGSGGTATPVFASRAAAATQDLSAFSAVQTLGYATAGDGGGATFKNIGSAPFLDANITAGTIVGGSGYVNGTYLFAEFTGGSGHGFVGKIVVSSGAVTSVTPVFNAGGYGYAVGDVLTTSNANLGGAGSGFTYTVTTLSTPKASFTDSAGNHWQYVVESFLDPRQFGAKWDWITTDTGATDDAASIQAALNYAAYTNTFQVNGNVTGSIVQMPRGSAKICSGLTLYGGVILRGHGPKGTSLRVCDAWANGAENILTLCDTVPHVACFGPQIADFDITATTAAAANVGTYAIYTNAAQQARAIQNVSVYAGNRGCLRYDTGYGGAAGFYVYDFFCTLAPTAVSNGIVINAGTTLFKFFNTILEAGGAGYASNGFNLVGGQITIDGLHSEGITTMINVDMVTSSHSATVMHVTGGNLCSEVVKLQGTNSAGNFAIYDGVRNGCTNLVTNGQSGGSSRTTDARPSAGWVSFNP